MKFAKSGLVIENNNPVFDRLYLKQGWLPVIDSENDNAAEEKTTDITDTAEEPDINAPPNPAEESLAKMNDEKTSRPEVQPKRTYNRKK